MVTACVHTTLSQACILWRFHYGILLVASCKFGCQCLHKGMHFSHPVDDRIFPHSSHSQEHSSNGVITYGGKDMKEVFPLNLSKAFGYESCFELVKDSIGVGLYFSYPFHTDWFLALWEFHEFPRSSFEHCLHLCVHCYLPLFTIWSS